jgi:dinuclear metal center YbgI/SA1388 family protein
MISREELALYLHEYLACASFNDYAPNGIQIEGKTSIRRICTAVTASESIIKKAAEQEADALLVHHGYFWRGEDPILTGMKRQRIGRLLAHDINLFAYHLPLDCHPDVGNNARLGKLFGVNAMQTHTAQKTPNLLWSGRLTTSMKPDAFSKFIEKTLAHTPIYISCDTEKPIQRIAWCSGAAQDFIEDAYQLGVDAYLSGEISERTYYQAKELGIHYFACGHHATERYGIQALGEHVAKRFKLSHQFIDSNNPV